MSKTIKVAHATPGRIRLKVPHAKGNEELLQAAAATFAAMPGVEQVGVNVVTGSLVLTYDPDRHDDLHAQVSGHCDVAPAARRPPKTEIDQLSETIENEAEFLAEHSKLVRIVVNWSRSLDREVRIATHNNVDLKLVFAGGVIAATVLEIGAAAATPVWMTLALFAMNHYVELHQRSAAQARAT